MQQKIATLVLLFFSLYALMSCTKEDPYSFETQIHRMYGDYKLSDINWLGGSVDLDEFHPNDETILTEMKNKIGYYEPDYTATVDDALEFSTDSESAKGSATAFNVTVPYPYYVVVDGEWKCTEIRSFKFTFRATEDTFKFKSVACEAYPKFNNPDDVFLSNVERIYLIADPDNNLFQVRLICTLPVVWLNSDLYKNILLYCYTK